MCGAVLRASGATFQQPKKLYNKSITRFTQKEMRMNKNRFAKRVAVQLDSFFYVRHQMTRARAVRPVRHRLRQDFTRSSTEERYSPNGRFCRIALSMDDQKQD